MDSLIRYLKRLGVVELKVSIITLHRVKNYGSVLQAYATQKLFQQLGAEAEIIDYISPRLQDKNARKILTQSSVKANSTLKKFIHSTTVLPSYAVQRRVFDSFLKKHINLTQTYLSEARLKEYPPQTDIYCTGSDQVFNSEINGGIERPFYLDFVPDGRRKIAYSASFGISAIPEKEKAEASQLLKEYSCISVREKSGLSILESLGMTGELVLDPVLCIDADELKSLRSGSTRKYKYILIYELNGDSNIGRYAQEIASYTGWKILRISYYWHHMFKNGKLEFCPSVNEFIELFINARLVLTDSFHAVALSVQFKRQFWAIMPPKYSTRLESILAELGISNRILLGETITQDMVNDEINYSSVHYKLQKLRSDSLNYLKKAVLIPQQDVYYSESCTGCGLCTVACPGNAVSMQQDRYGFKYPGIDRDKCLNCKECVICRVKDFKIFSEEMKGGVYAAKSANNTDLLKCSSGGLFGVLARRWLNEGGVVYGSAYDENLKVSHIRVDDEDDLKRLFGSKYVQSNMSEVYGLISEDLKNNVKVLFSGTPCQNAAVRRQFGADENLFLIDILCHGVPSDKIFKAYLSHLGGPDDVCVNYSFRDKSFGWGRSVRYELQDSCGKNKNFVKSSKLDIYSAMFYDGLTLRSSCYHCRYKVKSRVGDITLGDYWGIERAHPKFEAGEGASLVIVSSDKGRKLFDSILPEIICIESSLEKAGENNTTLLGNSPEPPERTKYLDLICEHGFDAAEKLYSKSHRVERFKIIFKNNILFEKLKRILKK